ncbi:MAG: efflux transporter outer membrane subunit [Gammaproteobacteria bacterium]|nr:efflux transporter outer membrane subunit [Gammaproteobacteria bacterium]
MIKTIRFFLCIILLSIFSGCALYGPLYKKPKINQPEQWKSKDSLSKVGDINLPTLPWWQKFNDKQLTYLIETAVHNNNDIQVAMGNVLDAQGELLQVQYSIIPSVNALLFGYANSKLFIYNPGYNAGVLPTYAINLFQYLRSSERATAEVRASALTRDTVALSVISQTAAGYFTYSGQSHLLTQQKQLVADLKELLFLSKKQYTQGLISLYTLQQYEQQYEQADAELPIVANNVVLSRNALKLLLNENPGDVGIGFKFMNLKSDAIVPTNLPSEVLKNRPDVRGAEQKLIASNAEVGVVTSTFFPTISLTNLGGSATKELARLFAGNTDFWSSLSLLTMPLVAPEYPGQIKSAKGLRYGAYREYIQVVRTAFKSVDDDLSAHQKYYTSFVAQGKNFSSSKKAYTLAEDSYEKGLYSYPTLLINKINMDVAAIDLTKSKIAQLTTIVRLYQDLGAGYAYQCKTNV